MQETQSSNLEPKKNPLVAGVVGVAVVAAAAIGLNQMTKSDEPSAEQNPEPQTQSPQSESNQPSDTHQMTSKYMDGTYSAVGSYRSPAGDEKVSITLTIKSDVITGASALVQATNPASVKQQTAFKENFAPLVIGKSLDEVSLTKVSGSSLTPKGFMDAVSDIKAEASM